MRISGKNMHFSLGDYKLKAQKVTLSITDNSAINKTSGVPDGYVDGDVEASGEMELTTQQFNLLGKAAKQAALGEECLILTRCSTARLIKMSSKLKPSDVVSKSLTYLMPIRMAVVH